MLWWVKQTIQNEANFGKKGTNLQARILTLVALNALKYTLFRDPKITA